MNKLPSKYLLRFFRWFCNPDYAEDIEGDLLERYERKPSKWLFALEVLKLLRPEIIRPFGGTTKLNNYGMFKHYFLITLRSFKKEKSYTVINLFGLILSISVSLLLWQYIDSEKSIDGFHNNLENKFRMNYSYFSGDELKRIESLTSNGLGPEVQKSLAGIKKMVRVRPIFSDEGLIVSSGTKKITAFDVSYVEDSFLEFFNYPLEKGTAAEALTSPNSIVLTNQSAKKHFGNENPIGKALHVSGGMLTGDFIVTGVIAETSQKTHLNFNYLIPIEYMLTHYGIYTRHHEWYWHNFYTYFELENGTSVAALSLLVDEIVNEKRSEELAGSGESVAANFQPLNEIYLDPVYGGDEGLAKGNALNLRIFLIVAIVVLIVACINYINLASARAIRKKEEVYLKKAIGANESQLITQFLFESLLFNIFSFGAALLICYFSIERFASLTGTNISFTLFQQAEFWIISLFTLIAISTITGLYPAFLSIKLGALKLSKNAVLTTSKGSLLRKSLIGIQLLISLLLVSATWLVYDQVTFMKSAEMGMDTDQLFVVQGPRAVIEEGRDVMIAKEKRFKEELLNHSSVLSMTGTSNVPGTGEIWIGGVRKLGDPKDVQVQSDVVLVDHNFSETYGSKFLAGEHLQEDMNEYGGILINETALKAFNFSSPHDAINQSLILSGWDTMRIHGVIEDVHWNSLQDKIDPAIYSISYYPAYFTLRLNTSNLEETLTLIESTYKELYPKDPYANYFLDDEFNRKYESEKQFGQIFGTLAIIAISISSFGLLSLIAYSLSQKVKEIGIRKVLGANPKHLFFLLSKEYLQVLLVAVLVGIPVIFFGAKSWLNNFAYRIDISIALFVFPAIAITLVTLLVISNKIISAMKIDPAKQLRDE